MALLLNPFPQTELVLGGTEQLWLVVGVAAALLKNDALACRLVLVELREAARSCTGTN